MSDSEAESGFLIDGNLYPVPAIDSFDMDEAQLLYDYSGLTIEDFGQPDSEEEEQERTRRLRNPGFLRTMLHVSYQRANPAVKPVAVRKLIGSVNILEALSGLADDAEDDARPPDQESTSRPTELSPNEPSSSSESSGGSSTNGSALPDSHPESIGVTRSDTSSPVSALTT